MSMSCAVVPPWTTRAPRRTRAGWPGTRRAPGAGRSARSAGSGLTFGSAGSSPCRSRQRLDDQSVNAPDLRGRRPGDAAADARAGVGDPEAEGTGSPEGSQRQAAPGCDDNQHNAKQTGGPDKREQAGPGRGRKEEEHPQREGSRDVAARIEERLDAPGSHRLPGGLLVAADLLEDAPVSDRRLRVEGLAAGLVGDGLHLVPCCPRRRGSGTCTRSATASGSPLNSRTSP